MKKSLFVICIATVLATASFSCKKTLSTIFGGIDADAPSITVPLPAIPAFAVGIEPTTPITFSSPFKLDSVIRANTAGVFGISAVNSITVKKVTITNNNGNNANNLSNLESFRILISSKNNSTKSEFIRATFPNTPDLFSYTTTSTSGTELLNYLKDDTIYYDVYGKARKETTQSLNLAVVVTLHVK